MPSGRATLSAVRREPGERQALVASILTGASFRTDPAGFHLWLSLPPPWTRSAFAGRMRSTRIGIVASDAFTTGDSPPEAVRVCPGGPADRSQVRGAPEFTAHAQAEKPSLASSFL